MDFDLTEEQRILKKSVHDFLVDKYPKDTVRKLEESSEGYDPRLWKEMAAMGWMGLVFPEAYDGSGGSFFDLIILLEETGYSTCPGPFFSTVVLGGLPILAAGSEDQKQEFLPAIASGELMCSAALTEPDAGYDASSVRVSARPDGDEYVINGTKLFVSDAHLAGILLCSVRTHEGGGTDEGISVLIVDAHTPGITITPLSTLARDKQYEVTFDQVRIKQNRILGEPDKGWPIINDMVEKATLARCAEMVGGAQAAMDMALAYAKERIQFDRPIGSFQAVQHHFANMWMDIYGSRVLLYKAALKISNGQKAAKEAAMAKARAGEAYRQVVLLAHQIFGGIGFTMEHDLHFYTRRAAAGDVSFGASTEQLEKVALNLGL